jgi:hypothetical protein
LPSRCRDLHDQSFADTAVDMLLKRYARTEAAFITGQVLVAVGGLSI